MWFLPLLSTAWAAPSAAQLQAVWDDTEPARAQHGQLHARLNPRDFEHLADGDVVTRLKLEQGHESALGLQWLPAAPALVWLALDDVDHSSVSQGNIRISRLDATTLVRPVSYVHVDLPFPLHDRQWVADGTVNTALFSATQGTCWERNFLLGDPALAPAASPEALWVPRYESRWLLLAVGGGTLAVFQTSVDLGGVVPGDLATRLARLAMDDAMEDLAFDAAAQPGHYGPHHLSSGGPDGLAMPALVP